MSLWDNNYINSFGQNKAKRDAARAKGDTDAAAGYQNQMNASVGGAALSAVQGAAGILDTSLQMAEAPDTAAYENQVDQMGMFRDGKTWDINQLMANRASIQPVNVTYEDVGGITGAGIAGGALSAGLAGAAAGMSIGGPWGALIGGVVGTGAGLIGGFTGKKKAEDQVEAINMASKNQQDLNNRYFNIQANKIQDFTYDNLWAHRAAQGGKIHIKKSNRGKFTEAAKRNHMTVQQFAKHVLSNNNKSKYSATMRRRANFARNSAGWKHAEGGQIETISDMDKFNTHGGYYAPNNLVRINTGGTHEQNPNGGVQYGMDAQGIPNLVEENENIYSNGGLMGGDYVFSDRIKATKSDLKRFGLPEKYEGLSFSSIADKLSAEARQRPNDAVSANGMGAMLDRLQACQEDHKARLEQSRMRRELNNMSPEELMALGAQMAQQPAEIPQEQMPMQEAQPMVEAPMMQQGMPMEQAPLMAACGGHIYRKLEDGTPGEVVVDPEAVLPEVYTPEDATIRGMQHFDERQERNAAINAGINRFFNGPDYVIGGPGLATEWMNPLTAVKIANEGVKTWAVGKGIARQIARETSKATRIAAKEEAAKKGAAVAEHLKEAAELRKAGKVTKSATARTKAIEAAREQAADNALARKAWFDQHRIFPQGIELPVETAPAVVQEGAKAVDNAGKAATTATKIRAVPELGTVLLPAGVAAGIEIPYYNKEIRGTLPKKGKDKKQTTTVNSARSAAIKKTLGIEAEGGPIARKYDGWLGSFLNQGPITTAMYNQPLYDTDYSYFTNDPRYTTGKVEWVRHPVNLSYAGLPAVTPLSTGTSTTTGVGTVKGAGVNTKKKSAGRQVVDQLERVTLPLITSKTERVTNLPFAFVETRYGHTDPAHNYIDAVTTKAGDPYAGLKAEAEANGLPALQGTTWADYNKKHPGSGTAAWYKDKLPNDTTQDNEGPTALPTLMRYAGALGNAGLAMYNAFQEPDRLNLGNVKPVFVNGRLALQDQRYNPMDEQSMVNQLQANTNAGYRALLNSGAGVSTPAAIMGAMYGANQNLGNALTQGRQYNDQLLANVISQNNNKAATEANFYNKINTFNTQTANQNAWQNYMANMRQQMYNNEQQTAKWNAVSQALDASLTDLSNIGRENFMMNQVNTNRALLGYWVDAKGLAHYTREDGSEVIADAKTGQVQQVLSKEEAPKAQLAIAPPTVASMSKEYQLPQFTLPTVHFGPFGNPYMIKDGKIVE